MVSRPLRVVLFVVGVTLHVPVLYAQRISSDKPVVSKGEREQVSLRNPFAKHFVTPDGKGRAIISAKPIHYRDGKGNFHDIDCSLQASALDGYFAQNTRNTISSFFPVDARKGVKVSSGKGEMIIGINPVLKIVTSEGRLVWSQRATRSRGTSAGNTITYSGLFSNASNNYQVDPNQLKNNLILNSRPSGLPGEDAFLVYSEVMQLPRGWRLSAGVGANNREVMLKGGLSIINEHGQDVFSIPVPDVFELNNPSNGVHNDGNWKNTYKVKFLGTDKYELSTMVPAEWLSDPSRHYPVVIDPTVTTNGNYGGWQNTAPTHLNGNPTSFVFVGLNTNTFTYNGWLRFNTSSIPAGATVTDTRLQLMANATGNAAAESIRINDVSGSMGPYGSYIQAVFDDLADGTYTDFECTTAGTYGFFDLGPNADNDVMNRLSTGNFQVGLNIASPTSWKRFTSNLAVLEVTYIMPPSGLDLASASDTGIDDADNITSDQTPTIGGAAPAGVTVRLYSGATEIGSVTSDGVTGAWQITSSSLTEGQHVLTATTEDAPTNVSSSSAQLIITIDNSTAPPTGLDLSATSDSGTDTDNITNDNTPTFSGTAEAGATVKLYSGATEIGSVTADGTTGVWQITAGSLTDGTKSITAKATDVAGNESGASSVLSITIDTSAPASPSALDLTASSDSGFNTDNITNDNTPLVSGSADVGVAVKLYNGATEIGSATADGTTGAWQITAGSLTDGTKSITAKATDVAGNESGASSVLSITIDTSAPTSPSALDLTASSDSGFNTDNITNDNTPLVSGSADVGVAVKLYNGATEIGSATADGTTGAWQITAGSLADGIKSITAKATDVAGNESGASSVLSITIDSSSPPSPTALDLLPGSDSGVNTDNITNDNTPSVSGSAEAGAMVKLYEGATEIGSVIADITTGAWLIASGSLTDGTKSITAKAIDVAGNESEAGSILTIIIDTSTAPPATLDLLATSDSHINTDDITNDNTPVISGTAEAGATVKLYNGTTEIGSANADGTTGEWQIISPSLTDGTKSITAKATDVAGNESGTSSILSLTIDTTSPPSPGTPDLSAASDTGINTDNITSDNTPTIAGNAEATATVKLYNGATEVGLATADGTTGAWQITTVSLTDGAKNITAKAFDVAGNESGVSSILSLTIDTTVPSPPSALDLVSASDSGVDIDNITNDNTPTITGSAEAGALVKLYDGATQIGSAMVDLTTSEWQITTSSLSCGTKNLTAKATDIAGNESSVSQVLNITLDGVRPAVTITSSSPKKTKEPFSVTIAFNEVVTGFDIADVIVTNGAASQIVDAGNSQYNVQITATSQGMITITIPENAASDVAGNGSTSASISREFDNAAPMDYTIRFMSENINIDNVNNVSLIIEGAEVGATYYYTITSEKGGPPLTGSGVVVNTQFTIDGLNIEELEDGLLTATIYLLDDLGNRGVDHAGQAMKTVVSEVIIHTSFSPNGDGINDVWKMQSLMSYDDVEIEVFDRAGARVFYTKDPVTGWDGRNHNGMVLTGGYMYVIRVRDTNLVKKGTLTLLK